MTIKVENPKFKTFYTVAYEQPNVKTGAMIRRVSGFVEDTAWFREQVEGRGGRIISESGPRQVESLNVRF